MEKSKNDIEKNVLCEDCGSKEADIEIRYMKISVSEFLCKKCYDYSKSDEFQDFLVELESSMINDLS